MPVLDLALRGCKLFALAPEEVLAEAARAMDIVNLKRREVLMRGGRPFKGLGVVLQGRLQALNLNQKTANSDAAVATQQTRSTGSRMKRGR